MADDTGSTVRKPDDSEEGSNADWYYANLATLEAKPNPTEADVSDNLVRPVLERVLGFGVAEIDAQPSGQIRGSQGQRPDFVCRRGASQIAAAIIEVKRLGTDLARRASPSAPWTTSPLGQLQNYLNRWRQAGDGTWGVVTNGTQWIVIRRAGDRVSAYAEVEIAEARSLAEVRNLLASIVEEPRAARRAKGYAPDFDWLSLIADCESPEQFIERAAPADRPILYSANDTVAVRIGEYETGEELFPKQALLVCMRQDFIDDNLTPPDIAEALSPLRRLPPGLGRAVGVAYTGDGPHRKCRGFVFDNEKLYTSALIAPSLPGSRAARQFEVLSKHYADLSPKAILDALSSTALHRSFHEEIGAWFARTEQDANELRHLVRVMFAWILQVRGILPDSALWNQGRIPKCEHDIHRHIEWLFGEVLARPKQNRIDREDEWEQALVKDAPFLNGSLFTVMSNDERPQLIANGLYVAEDGLLSILSRYDWTLCDRTGYESESALDPTMLGEMFEQLILRIEGVRLETDPERKGYIHRKMPGGTYYTPQDVADEMTADAIAGWLTVRVPGAEWGQIRELVHPMPADETWRKWSVETRQSVFGLIDKVTVFDPCCGSGVFTLAMLHALWRAKRRLSLEATLASDLENIIEHQLHAADIHPLAVLIARLRLFIALIDARVRSHAAEDDPGRPLPNLETRCMVANTLCIEKAAQSSLNGDNWDDGMNELRVARQLWTEAHDPEEKQNALLAEFEARDRLKEIAGHWKASSELAWLDVDFLSSSGSPAEFDVRKLFPAPEGGWDIVIGNPPYQVPDRRDRERGKSLEYVGASSNLYLMFIEAALEITRAGGNVTLVVPHSIIFRREQTYAKIRGMIESAADRIDFRTYDNMPQPLFPKLPWLKESKHGIQNRQRATVLTVQKRKKAKTDSAPSASGCVLHSRGLIRLAASTRSAVLKTGTLSQIQPKLTKQWSQSPTPELAGLLREMRLDITARNGSKLQSFEVVTFPPTAMYFVSCLPKGILDNPGRKEYFLADDSFFWPWIALYNSHLFHAYWLMVGDAFHVTTQETGTIRRPPGWDSERLKERTAHLAKNLLDRRTVDACRVMKKNLGEQHNVNFHKTDTPGPTLIAEIDSALLDAYGLPHDPLMQQMRTIREHSAHML